MMAHGSRWAGVLALGGLVCCSCTVAQPQPIDAGDIDANLVSIPETGPLDAGPPDAGGRVCDPGLIACGDSCTRVAADSLNCGSCGNACPAGVTCAIGRCDCHAPRLSCDGACTDLTADPEHCGACDHACGPTEMCRASECIVMCTEAGHAVCVNTVSGAREQVCADLQTDPLNCGACNTRCAGGATCVAGICACPAGQMACGGHCVDTRTDVDNCGACLSGCGAGGACVAGVCTSCGAGLGLCGSPAHCFDLASSRLHCGVCTRTCAAGQDCVAGTCACPSYLEDCGTSGCVDTVRDSSHCGDCTTVCGAHRTCQDSACACAPGYAACGPDCIDLMVDPSNCNACGNTCAAGQSCRLGACLTLPTRYFEITPSATDAPWVDACAAADHATILASVDNASMLVPLPFAFRYWATDRPAGALIDVSSNGWIGMDGLASSAPSGTIPSATLPNAVIAAHWGDLLTTAGGVCVATVGTAPNRLWVAEWNATYHPAGAELLSFEIVLHESSGVIDVIFGTLTPPIAAHVTGVEDPMGINAIGGCAAGACTPASDSRYRFNPRP
jgi:hypothetical protein